LAVRSLGLCGDIGGFHRSFAVTRLRGSELDDARCLPTDIHEGHGDFDLKKRDIVQVRCFQVNRVCSIDSLLAHDLTPSENELVSVDCRDYLRLCAMARDLPG
jgi:hypothetical protein